VDSNVQHGSELNVSNLEVNDDLPDEDVINIALFGLDNRDEDTDGHSDAIIILSVDRVHNKIKMTSIARDTLVKVDGYWSKGNLTKVTHAFSYGAKKKGESGPGMAVKTLNQNFGMNINRYMYVNFQGFAQIIDFLGGITIDVKQKELNELNNRMKYTEQQCGVKITRVKQAGVQRLDGWQALVYSRIRKMDSDIARGNRQKDVLEATFNEVKAMPVTKFPSLIAQGLQMCHTNLTSSEILSMATWAVTSSPEIVNFSIPDENNTFKAWGGTHPDYDWVWIMDLNYATVRLHDFIYETNVAENMTPRRYTLGGTIPIP
jgi:LCP family protein required for cell wall assembly